MSAPKLKRGIVKKAISGDTIVLLGPVGKNGLPMELVVTLYGLHAPRIDKLEPFAKESRNYLRTQLAAKEVQFANYSVRNAQQGHILLDGKDVSLMVLGNGWAVVNEKADESHLPDAWDEYQPANDQAKANNLGMYSMKPFKYGSKGDLPTNFQDLLEKTKGKTFEGYSEDIEYSFAYKMYLPHHDSFMVVNFKGVMIPIVNADHAKAARTFLFRNCIQQDVHFEVIDQNKEKDGLIVEEVDINDDSLTGRMLRGGFARMENNAAMTLEHDYFLKLKKFEDEAKNNKLGLWKDFQGQTGSSAVQSTFNAIVREVHSADSVTVLNTSNGEKQRIYLSNIKAPNVGNPQIEGSSQPWSFAGKEFLRNHIVGKTVKCEMEYIRKIPVKDDMGNLEKELVHQCASLFLGEENVAQTVVSQGYAKVTLPRGDDPFTSHIKELNEAEEEAKKKKLAVHSNKQAHTPKYWDLTTPENRKKIKNFNLSSLEGKTLYGVVEYVFSGSRFKVRVDSEKYYLNVQLNGVKTQGTDENMPERSIYGSKASELAKTNLHQRNVKLDVESIDKWGICHSLVYIGNKSFASMQVQAGLGYLSNFGKPSKAIDTLRDEQKVAQNNKEGVWCKFTEQTLGVSDTRTLNESNESFRGMVTEMLGPHEFYVQNVDSSEQIEIEEKIAKEYDNLQKLKAPIMDRTFCQAPFQGGLYRCQIIRKKRDNLYEVFFQDYGNKDSIPVEELYKTPNAVAPYKPQAIKCSLAYVDCAPDPNSSLFASALDVAYKQCWEKKLVIHVKYKDDEFSYVVVMSHNKTELTSSLNVTQLEMALARVSSIAPPKGELFEELQGIENKATEKYPDILAAFDVDDE